MLARQREFVADASHELRTPLTSVLANLELLEDELGGEQREAATSALRSTRRMRRLVADLLLLARADAGRVAPHATVDLAAVLVEAAAELEPVAGDHTLHRGRASRARSSTGARDELHRLVLNLIENAIKHTDPGTEVRARRRPSRPGASSLTVEDDGPGIPPELGDRVFERFVRGGADRVGLVRSRPGDRARGGRLPRRTGRGFKRTRRGNWFRVEFPSARDAGPQRPPVASLA